MTEYIVMQCPDPSLTGEWHIIGTTDSRSAKAAIRSIIKDKEGTYAAVPARSWQPVTVKIETRTQLRFQ